jgi:soluble lytic murein transglycosylase-like protein
MRRPALLLTLLLVASTSSAADDMYMWVDAQGTVHVTDSPRDGRFVPYSPGDLERWALKQSGRAHAGLGTALPRRDLVRPSRWDGAIASAASEHKVPFELVKAVVAAESGFNPRATSRAGAQGLMQLMPATAAELGVTDSFDPDQNIDGGTKYLGALLRAFKDEQLALAAYNAGPSRVAKLGRIPDIPETQAYVAKVLRLRELYAAASGPAPGRGR